MANKEVLGQTIRLLRKQLKMSQAELGYLVGRDASQISKIERATCGVSFDLICRIARALKVQPKQLLPMLFIVIELLYFTQPATS